MATSLQDLDPKIIAAALNNYYATPRTAGRGEYVQGAIFSRGRGLGSFFKAAIKAVAPIVKKAAHKAAPALKRTGQYMIEKGANAAIDTTVDMLNGVPAKEAFMENIEHAVDDVKVDAAKKLHSLRRKKLKLKKVKNGPLKFK